MIPRGGYLIPRSTRLRARWMRTKRVVRQRMRWEQWRWARRVRSAKNLSATSPSKLPGRCATMQYNLNLPPECGDKTYALRSSFSANLHGRSWDKSWSSFLPPPTIWIALLMLRVLWFAPANVEDEAGEGLGNSEGGDAAKQTRPKKKKKKKKRAWVDPRSLVFFVFLSFPSPSNPEEKSS